MAPTWDVPDLEAFGRGGPMEHPAVETLARALAGLDADACVRMVEEVGRAVGPERLLTEIYLPALSRVGDIWARGLLDDLAFAQAAVIAEQLWGLVAPGATGPGARAFAGGERQAGPSVVVGVLAPDRHDIGKNQAARLLADAGARVTDVGAEAEPAELAAKAKEVGASAVMVGASTQPALARLAELKEALAGAGVSARVLVGGQAALAAPEVPDADAVIVDAYDAVERVFAPTGEEAESDAGVAGSPPGGTPGTG